MPAPNNISTYRNDAKPYPPAILRDQRLADSQVDSASGDIRPSHLNQLVVRSSVRSLSRSEESEGILPAYPHRFTSFIPNKNKNAIEIPGYASVEDFLSSESEESEEVVARYPHKNPHQEAIALIALKKSRIEQHIDVTYRRIRSEIEDSTDPVRKEELAAEFIDEAYAGVDGLGSLEARSQEVVASMKEELDVVRFRKKNRWLAAGAWPNTLNETAWNRQWQTRLNDAKAAVENGVRTVKVAFYLELDSKLNNLEAELSRLATAPELTDSSEMTELAPTEEVLAVPPPVFFLPPSRSGSLRPYPTPFTSYNPGQPEKDGLDLTTIHIGYDQVEDFLCSKPNHVQRADRSGYKNPKQEAQELLMTGGFPKIIDHIRARSEFYKQKIQSQPSLEAKQRLSQAFSDEMNANKPAWKDYLQQDKNQVSLAMEEALDTIRFRKPSRWFPQVTKQFWDRETWTFYHGSPWTYSSVKERWNREWFTEGFPAQGRPPRLNEAKAAVTVGLEQTLHEALEELDSTIAEQVDNLRTEATQ